MEGVTRRELAQDRRRVHCQEEIIGVMARRANLRVAERDACVASCQGTTTL